MPARTALPATTRKGRATRERIVAAAAALMYEQGVAVTSLAEVKTAAGVSSSQLYHYFADKHAIVAAVIAYQTRQVLDFQRPMLVAIDSVESLAAWRDAIVALQADAPIGRCPIGSLASELSERDGDHHRALVEGLARWEDAIRDGLTRMRDGGRLRADADTDALASALLAALEGGLLLAHVRRTTAPLEAALDEMIARIASLRPAPSTHS